MIVETGHYALVLALALACVQVALPLWGGLTRDRALMATSAPLAGMQFVLVALAFAALTYAHVVSDFSLVNVVENSHSQKPLIYKISGVWGNHEGSMLLWVLILALFGALVAAFAHTMPAALKALVLSMQGLIALAFLSFIVLTSDPFARLFPAPAEGQDLNPILQDPGLAIHPPLLYVGYVGFSMTFSFAAGALIDGRIDAAWARWVRPWALVAWVFLTLGIAMGSYWAYYTLGWGGFWFWDPVENASLMPWLAGTALLHSIIVMEKRDALKVWTIFLSILTFSLSLLGTFLVRSGVLTSVHAFANDPRRGVFILAILVFFIGGSLTLFAWRAPVLKQGGLFAPISREGGLVLNNLFLTIACGIVFTGTLYPLAFEALTGGKISVGAPYFNLTFVPLTLALMVIVPFGQRLAWKRGDLLGVVQRLLASLVVGLAVLVALEAMFYGGPVLAPIAASLAAYIILGSLGDLSDRIFVRASSWQAGLSRAAGLPLSVWGTALAHAGVGVALLGLAATGWGVERIVTLRLNEPVELGPYQVTIDRLFERPGPNYREAVAHAMIRSGGAVFAEAEPSKRSFATRQMQTTEAGIVTRNLGQIYLSLGDQHADGSVDMRLYWKPLVTLIWFGAIIMALGGTLSLADRRIRLGIARRAKSVPAAAQAAE
ncbi:heme lyase CcmF/NrfE family subunit [Methylovirgula sp. 4M-Z18]|uniref:heme lyase CcmF/NrfE family subunit n=1 Tax=Methylovirgula sp. 4M-Z18 TaxID=2293567 RepID=UPI000E2FD7D3|nr:heme lyase CcmF/NrfE family subunit [Methylovirgula sp. 4M-Z18]RFB76318.1 heme lyase CcmF/NrfE family subunit [Methylovirgula sp. 4M-Z18]